MERREFLAALGTAATISSTSQVLAQTGGGSPQQVNVALYVRLEAKPGKEEAVADFLRQGKALVEAEPATIAWFGVRLGPSTFAIFDAFPDEAGRQAHLAGKVAAALMAKAGDLLAQPPAIHKADVLASKLPG
jgi:quinol monooxygenase YgiN